VITGSALRIRALPDDQFAMPAQSGGRRTLVDTTTCGDPGC